MQTRMCCDSYLLVQAKVWGIKARLIACIQGGQFAPERERHAAGIVRHSEVSGVMLGGLGTGESPELRQELIHASLSRVPQRLPRVLAAGIGQLASHTWNSCWLVMSTLSSHLLRQRTSYLYTST